MDTFRQAAKKTYVLICHIEAAIAAIFLLTTVVVIFTLAIFRTFGVPINWALDTALLVFAWGVFLGADVAFREDKLVNVDFVLTRLPGRIQTAVQLFLYLLIGGFLLLLIYHGVDLSISTQHRSFQGIPRLSYTWVTTSIPVCSFLMLITLGLKIYRMFSPAREGDDSAETGPEPFTEG